jgi:hypothetical protein
VRSYSTVFVNVEPVGDIMVLNDLFTRSFHLCKSDERHKLNAVFVYRNLCVKIQCRIDIKIQRKEFFLASHVNALKGKDALNGKCIKYS